MVIATAGMVANEARDDGSVINTVLKLAVIVVIGFILIAAAIWLYLIVANWDTIVTIWNTFYAFFGGGLLGYLNPFSSGSKGESRFWPKMDKPSEKKGLYDPDNIWTWIFKP